MGQDNFFHQFLTVRETVSHFARLQYPHLDEGDLSEKVFKRGGGGKEGYLITNVFRWFKLLQKWDLPHAAHLRLALTR